LFSYSKIKHVLGAVFFYDKYRGQIYILDKAKRGFYWLCQGCGLNPSCLLNDMKKGTILFQQLKNCLTHFHVLQKH